MSFILNTPIRFQIDSPLARAEDFSINIDDVLLKYSGFSPQFSRVVSSPDVLAATFTEDKLYLKIPVDLAGSYEVVVLVTQYAEQGEQEATITLNVRDSRLLVCGNSIQRGDKSVLRWYDSRYVYGAETIKGKWAGKGQKWGQIDTDTSDSNSSYFFTYNVPNKFAVGSGSGEYHMDDQDMVYTHANRVGDIAAGTHTRMISLNNSDAAHSTPIQLPSLAKDAEVVFGPTTQVWDSAIATPGTTTAYALKYTVYNALRIYQQNIGSGFSCIGCSLGDGYPAAQEWTDAATAESHLTEEMYQELKALIPEGEDPVFVLTPGNNGDAPGWLVGGRLYPATHCFVMTRTHTPTARWFAERTIISGAWVDSRSVGYRSYRIVDELSTHHGPYGTLPVAMENNYLIAYGTDGFQNNRGSIGTSFAQPVISGAVLSLRSMFPTMTGAQCTTALLESAWDQFWNYVDYGSSFWGKGVLDIDAAIGYIQTNFGLTPVAPNANPWPQFKVAPIDLVNDKVDELNLPK